MRRIYAPNNSSPFPSQKLDFRCRLAAQSRRTAHSVRQATLGQLQAQFRDLLPAPLLSSEDEGCA